MIVRHCVHRKTKNLSTPDCSKCLTSQIQSVFIISDLQTLCIFRSFLLDITRKKNKKIVFLEYKHSCSHDEAAVQQSACAMLMKSFFCRKKKERAMPNCCLCFIMWCLKRVYSVVLSFASSVYQWGWWEKAVTSHQGASEAVWGRHLFRGNQHIQKLDCSSAGVDALQVLIF